MDNQYVRRWRQHIPFYKADPIEDRRLFWYHRRVNCDLDCVFGIPVVQGQFIMFALEDDSPTDEAITFTGASANSVIELCCMDQGDASDCPDLNIQDVQQQSFTEYRICVLDGEAIQFNYIRFKFPSDTACGLHYLKIIAFNGTPSQRIFYSQPIHVYNALEASRAQLLKLNIDDSCSIGGIDWSQIFQGWGNPTFIKGYEVYLPYGVKAGFVEEVTNEETIETGDGDEEQTFESIEWRYETDSGYVPEFYAEFLKEITHTDNNCITFPDNQGPREVPISKGVSDISSDGDGCLVNINLTFRINRYTYDKCCQPSDPCECPGDDPIQVRSYTAPQTQAEANASTGDIFIVPDGATGVSNPDWQLHNNELATWDGNDWVYSPNTDRLIALNEVDGKLYISLGVGLPWSDNLLNITSTTYNGLGTCTWVIESIIPHGTFAKLQWMQVGSGIWNDSTGTYVNSDDWKSGVNHSQSIANNYELRLVPLGIGCDELENSEIVVINQPDSCV